MRQFRSKGRALPRPDLLARAGAVTEPKPRDPTGPIETAKAAAALLLAVAMLIGLWIVLPHGGGW